MSLCRPFAIPSTLCLLAALTAPPPLSAAVYRCTTTEGTPRFSQFPCGTGEAVVIEPLHTVRIPPLSDDERRLLDELEQQRRVQLQHRAEARRRAATAARAEREARQERCAEARAERDALDRQRRKGYSLEEARALDRRNIELEAAVREHC